MATYKEIKGVTVQTLDSDPVLNVGTWSSGGSVNTARRYGAGIGSSTAGLIFGGSSPSPAVANTEQYNGTAWTEVNDLNAAQNAQGSAGTLTSGMSALGAQSPGANVEDWNGSTWSANPHSLNSARQFPGGDGASNDSALMVGGEPSPNGALTEIYNGSSWTESGDLNTARNQLAAAGTVTALIAMGGNTGADAETFNGSAWTAVTDMNSGSGGISGSGTSTLALAFAGDPDVANTESWNGSAWTEVNDLSTGREFGASSNITGNTTAFLASGYTTTLVSNTEEWSFPPTDSAVLTEGDIFLSAGTTLKGFGKAGGIPTGSWASGGSMNTARSTQSGAGAGQDSALAYGGSGPGDLTESYNGTSWSELAEINTARTEGNRGLGGTQTSALLVSGAVSGTVPTAVESWNGSSWTEIADVNSSRYNNTGAIPNNTTGMIFGGENSGFKVTTEIWDGTSWTEVGDLLTPVNNSGGTGTVTAAICVGGQGPPNAAINETVTWNGSSWTEVTAINRNVRGCASAGIQTSALISGGDQPPYVVSTEFWNGSSWTELNNLSTAIGNNSGGGNAASAISAGGNPGPVTAQTEEWTATNTLSTITIS